MEFQVQVHGCQEVVRREYRRLVKLLFHLELLHGLWVCTWVQKLSACWSETSKAIVHVLNGLEAHAIICRLRERCKLAHFRKLTGLDAIRSSPDFPVICYQTPTGALEHILKNNSCEFALFSISSFMESSFPADLSEVSSLSSGLRSNCSLQFETAP